MEEKSTERAGSGKRFYPHEMLDTAAVTAHLETALLGSTMAVLRRVDSTNTYIKRCFSALDDGFAVLAEQQTLGKGRRGKTFVSPEGGLYMSVLLLGHDFPMDAVMLTVRAAIAVKNALRNLTQLPEIGIKWVNDIYCGNKKVCGILAERVIGKSCDFTVLGIGINVFTPQSAFRNGLEETAGALCDFTDIRFSRNELAAEVLNRLEEVLSVTDEAGTKLLLDDYRASSVIIGKDVYVLGQGEPLRAKVLGIDDSAALYVQYPDGKTDILRSGDVSTRLAGGEETE